MRELITGLLRTEARSSKMRVSLETTRDLPPEISQYLPFMLVHSELLLLIFNASLERAWPSVRRFLYRFY